MHVLFLDFDGVLHAQDCLAEHQMGHLPHLVRLLRKHREVQVVVSSSWRWGRTLGELRAFFPVDLRDRVIGMTPVLEWLGQPAHRQRECLAWLEENAPGATWVAVDDDTTLFEPDRVVLCDPAYGLSDAQVSRRFADRSRGHDGDEGGDPIELHRSESP